ncbi:MAG: alanine--tRNA ligase [Clostridia bacterium]|nr:alanine--tRNA ligase [Clostridia bacterium]
MQWTGLNEIREKFLSFFEAKGHLRLGSFSLIPNNDNSLLLINSGMAPMKKYFTGEITPPRNRVTTCQKCIRTPDIDRVGITARHGTFFEMLGNFSFGDYFKNEAIPWAWEFLTETMEIPKDLLWPSVYEEDDEAYAIWRDKIGVPEERIVRLGKEDNFWEHGTGPCGPCSEIYFDRGEKYGCGKPDCKPGCDCDRYMEIWNNVFSQFNNMGDGTYTELEHKNIDTGMGLERLACVIQGVDNMFEVDTIRNILDTVCSISGVTYGADEKNDISIRAITDHARASTFMISDGIIPSNEGRGYVLRRLIRRAARHGRLLGINRPFLSELCDVVIRENKAGYPELSEKQELIRKVISFEEAAFSKTIDQGLGILSELTKNGGVLSGEDAFKLYDTYGFPLDLTKDILAEKGMTLDEDTFNACMSEQKKKARASRKAADAESWRSDGISFENIEATKFTGYTENESKAKILSIVSSGEFAPAAAEGEKVILVLDQTPFYAESGGQVGDTGEITSAGGVFKVLDTTKTNGGIYMHLGEVLTGEIVLGDEVTAGIDVHRREAIRRNHTAAHLLQAALRKILGTHVEQAGQLVTAEHLRFDFTHFSALTKEEITEVEALVNQEIMRFTEVTVNEMPIAEARALGAMALFGEKYGEVVRVVRAGDFSIELCGGTHATNTAKLGLFKIVSEGSVAAGVRRIEAVTGEGVLSLIAEKQRLIDEASAAFKVNNSSELPAKALQAAQELREKDKQIEALSDKLAAMQSADLFENAQEIGGVTVLAEKISGSADALRTMCDQIREKAPKAAAILAAVDGGKITFAATCGKEAVALGLNAGKIVKAAAQAAGGNGGGRPDFAMAGGKATDRVEAALEAAVALIRESL